MENVINSLREHPRVVERRLIMIHERAVKVLSEENVDALFEFICERHHVKFNVLSQVLASKHEIMKASQDPLVDRQELILAGVVYGEKRTYIAKEDLGVTSGFLYQNKNDHNPEYYITDEWIKDLGSRTVSLRIRTWYDEVIRFLEYVQLYLSILPTKGS